MKQTITFLLLLVLCGTAHAQYDFFNDYENTRGVSVTYISREMLNKSKPIMTERGLISESIIKKLSSLRTISSSDWYSYGDLKQKIDNLLKNGKYESLLRTSENGKQTIILTRKTEKKNENEILLYTYEFRKKLSLIVLTGDLTIKDISTFITDDKGK